MSTHTPGPWSANDIPSAPEKAFRFATAVWLDRTDEGGRSVLICSVAPESFEAWQPSKEEQTANAHLIAAAPALLAACRAAVSQFETEGYAGTLAHAACVHALKLAEGQECDT